MSAPSSAPTSPVETDQLVVRGDVRRDLRAMAILLGVAVLLMFWIPAAIVLWRPEAAYFTNGILWTALIATVLVLVIGIGLTAWWSRRGTVLLTVNRDGVQLPARRKRPALKARWDELTLVRLVGSTDPILAFYLPPVEDTVQDAADKDAGIDLTEPEFLRPLDFDRDPPPSTTAPGRDAFERITPVPQDEEDPAAAAPEPRRSPAEQLHATPYVVQLERTNPPLQDILRAITRYSAGRVPLQ